VVQLSATPSSGATARDADLDRRFVRVVLQLATSTATTDCAARGGEYRHDGQGGRELDSYPNTTATSPSWGDAPAPGNPDTSRAGKLLLSWISATSDWSSLTHPDGGCSSHSFLVSRFRLDVTVQGLFLLLVFSYGSIVLCPERRGPYSN